MCLYLHLSVEQLSQLKSDLRCSNLASYMYAESTRENLKEQWQALVMFCIYFRFTFLPASTSSCQVYAQFLSRCFKSVSSIRNYLSGVRTVHLLLGFDLEKLNAFLDICFLCGAWWDDPVDYKQIVNYRLCNNYLPIETLRWYNVDRNDRICHLCNSLDVGDENHYLFTCSQFNQLCKKLLPVKYLNTNTLNYCSLMNENDETILLNLC